MYDAATMLTVSELLACLADLESDRVERTQSVSDTDKFSEAICAFANDLPGHRAPGYLIIGANDRGVPTGLTVTDTLLQQLAAIRSSGNVQPLPALAVSKFALPGGEVAVVEVTPSDLPPVRYKGRIHVRVGPRKAIASEQEERILTDRRTASAQTVDALPMTGATLDDLSLGLFAAYRQGVVSADVIADNHRTIEEQLASLRFFDLRRGCPTLAGVLLFGKRPRHHLPGAYVQFLRLPGAALTERPVDQAEISGDLHQVVRELDVRVRGNIRTGLVPVSALQEDSVSDYPEVALRELLLNAVMHRDYRSTTPVRFYWFADHLEIQSPGGLYGEVTPETLTQRSSYRNPVVAEAMKALGFVNRYGYGIQRAEAALAKNGNPPLEWVIDDRVVLVRVHRRAPLQSTTP